VQRRARGYIDEHGRDPGPGQAILYGTTPAFLEKLGLQSLDDLPPIAEFIPGADVVEALEHGLRVTPQIDVSTATPDGERASTDPPLDR
jgi:segregation and condensation protein B